MIPLAVIVLDELRDCLPEVPLTDWNDAIETFFLDRPDESLGVGVGVSSRLHRLRAVRHKLSGLRIPSIRSVAGRFR